MRRCITQRATVGWFDRAARDYRRIEVARQCEVLSLIGDIALGPDGSTRGGHLLEGRVYPTLEVVVRETPAELRKTYRPDVGPALIGPGRP